MSAPSMRRPSTFPRDVLAGFSTRHGGHSRGPYESMNLGLSTGDDEASVRENRDALFGVMGKSGRDLAVAGQVHGANVSYVDGPGLYPNSDGLVADLRDQILAITVADCAVVLMADEVAGVTAACHAGWRGAVKKICSSAIDKMEGLGADPGRMHAYISPAISVEAFEVGHEVAEQFDRRHVVRRPGWDRPHVDLKRALADEIASRGVPIHGIEVSKECTFGNPDFYSHRFSRGRTGRMMGFIMLRPHASG